MLITRSLRARAVGSVILCLAFVTAGIAADAPNAPKSRKAQKRATQKSKTSGHNSGMVISRDPDSGQLQSGVGVSQPASAARVAEPAPQQVRLPNGLVMIRSTSQHMSTSVVTRDADGRTALHCVDGDEQAQKLIRDYERDRMKHQKAGKDTGDAR